MPSSKAINGFRAKEKHVPLKTLAKALSFAVVLASVSAPAQANDEIRKIDTFHLRMTIDEFKTEVAKKFPDAPRYIIDSKIAKESGETEELVLRTANRRDNFSAKAAFESSLSGGGAYGIAFKQPITGEYAENYELVWNSVVEKYGEPDDYVVRKIKGSVFQILARWAFNDGQKVKLGTCGDAFDKFYKFRVNKDCGTFVYVGLRGANSVGSLSVTVIDHVAGAKDFALRNPDQAEAEKPKF